MLKRTQNIHKDNESLGTTGKAQKNIDKQICGITVSKYLTFSFLYST